MFRILKYLLPAVLVAGLAACSPDADFVDDGGLTTDGERPVEFTFALPDAGTRAVENPKTRFTESDVIHIEGVFVMKDGTETIRYGAMSYTDQGTWKSLAGSELRWPNLAESGTFTAYYVAKQADEESGGLLHPGGAAVQVRLDALKNDGDPLMARSPEGIGYGHAVMLRFHHLCAYLTLNYLEPMVATSYWFTRKTRDGVTFNNAFKLYLDEDKHLRFAFCQDSDNHYTQLGSGQNGFVYIASAVSDFNGGNGGVGARTTYFLEPGLYEDFSLVYRNSETEYTEYLQYDYSKIPDSAGHGKTKPDFRAGVPYVLEINKSSGVTMVSPSDGNETWDTSNECYEVDVEKFLRAISKKEAYSDKNVQILEKTATGTKLLKNVDFKFAKYDIFGDDDFKPNVTGGTFDGGNHYIANLGCPLFYINEGIIENLRIKGIDTTRDPAGPFLVSEEDAVSRRTNKTYDLSRTGGLCRLNRETGIIRNVRISDGVKIVVKVKSKKDGSKDENGNTQGTEAHNVGSVAGSNVGTIRDVELAGDFEIEVSNHEATQKNLFVQLNVGGIVGQNGANGRISSVNPDGEPKIKVTNGCKGPLAAFYMGGIVGSNSGYLSDIIVPNLEVDGSGSEGLTAYIGGLAGDLSANAPEGDAYTAGVTSCTVSGTIRGGNVTPKGDLTCAILAGGLAGATLHTPVTDCQTAVSVYNTVVDLSKEGIVCATGGAFGRIRKEGSDMPSIREIIAYGDALQGPTNIPAGRVAYIGNFAGLTPDAMSWNFVELQIIVKTYAGVADIGGSTD